MSEWLSLPNATLLAYAAIMATYVSEPGLTQSGLSSNDPFTRMVTPLGEK